MNDPYIHDYVCQNRLLDEWIKYGKIIIAVDFDDTVYDYHNKGHSYTEVIDLVRECEKVGAYITAFTASPPDRYDFVRSYFSDLQIPLSSINENPILLPFGNHRKIFYNILLDDRAGLGQAVETLRTALTVFTIYKTQNTTTTT